jgi:SSS family solute:Na+ symporter
MANRATDVPAIQAKLEARATLAAQGAALTDDERTALRARAGGDDVILRMVEHYAPIWLTALFAAGVMAAVMASDSQILALSTMFTEDVFAFYEGKARFGERAQVVTGRIFVVVLTLLAYAIALRAPQSIFDLATQYAFAGYSALAPLLVAALFWKGSTRWGAFASAAWTAGAVIAVAVFQSAVPTPPPGVETVAWAVGGTPIVSRVGAGTTVLGLLPVVPMTIGSAVLMIVVSKLTGRSLPAGATLARYFPRPAHSRAGSPRVS